MPISSDILATCRVSRSSSYQKMLHPNIASPQRRSRPTKGASSLAPPPSGFAYRVAFLVLLRAPARRVVCFKSRLSALARWTSAHARPSWKALRGVAAARFGSPPVSRISIPVLVEGGRRPERWRHVVVLHGGRDERRMHGEEGMWSRSSGSGGPCLLPLLPSVFGLWGVDVVRRRRRLHMSLNVSCSPQCGGELAPTREAAFPLGSLGP